MKHAIPILSLTLVMCILPICGLQAQWVKTLSGYAVSSLAVSGTNLFAGTEYSGVFLTTNNGTTWTAVNNGLTDTSVYALVVSDTRLFAGTHDGVFLSTNSGTTWNACIDSGLTNTFVYLLAFSGTNLFAGTYSEGLFLSTNDGSSWINVGFKDNPLNAIASSGTNLFVGSENSGVYLSADNGSNWRVVNSGLSIPNIFSLAMSERNLFVGLGGITSFDNIGAYGGGVFRSTNNGTNWNEVDSGLSDTTLIKTIYISGSNVFAGPFYGGVFLSTNNGTSWHEVDSGFTIGAVHTFAICGTDLFTGTLGDTGFFSGSVWKRPLSQITAINSSEIQNPGTFSLNQNYPNPFNPSTTISFSLPSQSFVSLKVFDIVGREVATIASEILSAGNYLRRWNAQNITSGIYFYRLHAGSLTETKKLILLK